MGQWPGERKLSASQTYKLTCISSAKLLEPENFLVVSALKTKENTAQASIFGKLYTQDMKQMMRRIGKVGTDNAGS